MVKSIPVPYICGMTDIPTGLPAFDDEPDSSHTREVVEQLIVIEEALQADRKWDGLRLIYPNFLLLAFLGLVTVAAMIDPSSLLAELRPERVLVGAALIAAGFGLYGLSVLRASRLRLLELKAVRLQLRAMAGARAMQQQAEDN